MNLTEIRQKCLQRKHHLSFFSSFLINCSLWLNKFNLTVFKTSRSPQRFHHENKTDSWFWQCGNWHVRLLTKPRPNYVLDVSIFSYDYLQPLSANSLAKSRPARWPAHWICWCYCWTDCHVIYRMMLTRWIISIKLWLETDLNWLVINIQGIN